MKLSLVFLCVFLFAHDSLACYSCDPTNNEDCNTLKNKLNDQTKCYTVIGKQGATTTAATKTTPDPTTKTTAAPETTTTTQAPAWNTTTHATETTPTEVILSSTPESPKPAAEEKTTIVPSSSTTAAPATVVKILGTFDENDMKDCPAVQKFYEGKSLTEVKCTSCDGKYCNSAAGIKAGLLSIFIAIFVYHSQKN